MLMIKQQPRASIRTSSDEQTLIDFKNINHFCTCIVLFSNSFEQKQQKSLYLLPPDSTFAFLLQQKKKLD